MASFFDKVACVVFVGPDGKKTRASQYYTRTGDAIRYFDKMWRKDGYEVMEFEITGGKVVKTAEGRVGITSEEPVVLQC